MSKVVLITGTSSGIGKSIAEYLFQKGLTVYGTSRSPIKKEINGVKMLELDVTNVSSIENAVAKIIANEGVLDVLINNAGMGITGPVKIRRQMKCERFSIQIFLEL